MSYALTGPVRASAPQERHFSAGNRIPGFRHAASGEDAGAGPSPARRAGREYGRRVGESPDLVRTTGVSPPGRSEIMPFGLKRLTILGVLGAVAATGVATTEA